MYPCPCPLAAFSTSYLYTYNVLCIIAMHLNATSLKAIYVRTQAIAIYTYLSLRADVLIVGNVSTYKSAFCAASSKK